MKKLTFTALSTCALLLVAATDTKAQKKTDPPDVGHWQVVSNIHNKKAANVQFYNNDGMLMYEEKIHGKKLNPARKKVAHDLNSALVEAHATWMKDQYAVVNQKDLFTKRLKPKNPARFASVRQ